MLLECTSVGESLTHLASSLRQGRKLGRRSHGRRRALGERQCELQHGTEQGNGHHCREPNVHASQIHPTQMTHDDCALHLLEGRGAQLCRERDDVRCIDLARRAASQVQLELSPLER